MRDGTAKQLFVFQFIRYAFDLVCMLYLEYMNIKWCEKFGTKQRDFAYY